MSTWWYDELIKISKTDDVIGRMQRYFVNEVGYKECHVGNFKNIYYRAMNYHRLSLDERVFDEFHVVDGKHIDWQGFIAKLKELLSISYDLDEVLGKKNSSIGLISI
jgi:hypothetical protein